MEIKEPRFEMAIRSVVLSWVLLSLKVLCMYSSKKQGEGRGGSEHMKSPKLLVKGGIQSHNTVQHIMEYC